MIPQSQLDLMADTDTLLENVTRDQRRIMMMAYNNCFAALQSILEGDADGAFRRTRLTASWTFHAFPWLRGQA